MINVFLHAGAETHGADNVLLDLVDMTFGADKKLVEDHTNGGDRRASCDDRTELQ